MPLVRRRRLRTRYSNGHGPPYLFPPPFHRRRRSSTFSSRHQSYSKFSKSLRMVHEFNLNDNSSTKANYGSSDSFFEIKIKTLNLQTYSFRVNRNMPISALKEEILTKIGVSIEEQRLLYKGVVLNNDQLLSELNLEEGDPLHLVERKPVQSHLTSSTVVADTTRTSSSQGARVESSQNTSRIQFDYSTNEARILLDEVLPSVPFARMPSLQPLHELMVIPNALTTISAFIDRMERMLPSSSNSFNTSQHQTICMNTTTEFLNTEGMPNPEYLSFTLDRTGQLLRDNTATAISHLSTLLRRRDGSYNPFLRDQIRFEAVNLGVAMQHLGAMLLELGRVTMCLRFNHTFEESVIDAGHAVYISRTGPNPIMIQPFPSTSWTYNPAIFRIDPSDHRSSASRFPASGTSTGYQCHQPTLQPPLLSGSDFVPTLGAQFTASIPNARNSNAQLQSSSNAMQSGATQDLNAAELLLDISNDGVSDDSENVVGTEDCKQNSSGENCDSDLAVSGKVEQQVDLGQAVELIEKNGGPESIFGALLETSVRLYGEQDVYQDILELGNNEELANEFTEVLRRDVLRSLAKKSFV